MSDLFAPITIRDDIKATYEGRGNWSCRFPYSPEAVAILKAHVSGYWEPGTQSWNVFDTLGYNLTDALKAIAEVSPAAQPARRLGKDIKIIVEGDFTARRGDTVDHEGSLIEVGGLSQPFTDRRRRRPMRFLYGKVVLEAEAGLQQPLEAPEGTIPDLA